MSSIFDFLVVGAGSGGIATARRAAEYGSLKIGVVENARLGGTCVNVGCVPKKIMWCAATVSEILSKDAKHYGFEQQAPPVFSWDHLKNRRDASVSRLNEIYRSNLEKSGIELIRGCASFERDDGEEGGIVVRVGDRILAAKRILIATGGRPAPSGLPGAQEAGVIDSDGFFSLAKLPQHVAVVGAGYIAVELASMLKLLGCEQVDMFFRGDVTLRRFDSMLKEKLDGELRNQGIVMHPNSVFKGYSSQGIDNKHVITEKEDVGGFDVILEAIGRSPNIEGLNLESVGVEVDCKTGAIRVDDFQVTTNPKIFALGDVCGKVELTPMAIAAGRLLADRIFLRQETRPASYDLVPTVIFSHPPIGTIGLTEEESIKKYGQENLIIYKGVSVNLFYNVHDILPERKPRTHIKLICLKNENEKIIGLHIIGMGVDEMLQGFGVAIKMGATKADFDQCVAIHPTAAEEVVTLAPWGRPLTL